MTLLQAVYGQLPLSISSYTGGTTTIQAVEEDLLTRDALLQQLKVNLQKAHNRMQQQANKKRRDIEFQSGDLVLVKLQPYHQSTVAQRLNSKLCRRYFGPCKVVARQGEVAYTLELSANSHIHPTFHVSLLKPFHGPLPVRSYQLSELTVANRPMMYKITNLEDKVVFEEGRSDSPAQDLSPIKLDSEAIREGIRDWIESSAQEEDPTREEELTLVEKENQQKESNEEKSACGRRNRVRPKWLTDFVRMERC
uniref:S1-like domain-containing protein n=1 Tax=Cannabis sativa TaxID=3483 RepID=A0A803PMN3_CANSA